MRMLIGVVAGFIAWLMAWLGIEMLLSAIWPGFGAHQRAFQAAITNGAPFTPDSVMLTTHVVVGGLLAALSGAIAAGLSGERARTPVVMGTVLLVLALMKAAMSWSLVPVWYHLLFAAALFVMAIVGGRVGGVRR